MILGFYIFFITLLLYLTLRISLFLIKRISSFLTLFYIESYEITKSVYFTT